MYNLNWRESIERVQQEREILKVQDIETAKSQGAALEKLDIIFRGMDFIVKGFMKSAAEQHYPSATNIYNIVEKENIFGKRSQKEYKGFGYHSPGLNPHSIYHSINSRLRNDYATPLAAIYSNGDWVYVETGIRKDEWITSLWCENNKGDFSTHGEVGDNGFTESVHSRLMDTLAKIALSNGIELKDS